MCARKKSCRAGKHTIGRDKPGITKGILSPLTGWPAGPRPARGCMAEGIVAAGPGPLRPGLKRPDRAGPIGPGRRRLGVRVASVLIESESRPSRILVMSESSPGRVKVASE